MKKISKKLLLKRETLQPLTRPELNTVDGAGANVCSGARSGCVDTGVVTGGLCDTVPTLLC